jgi:signal transduction histidine kinase
VNVVRRLRSSVRWRVTVVATAAVALVLGLFMVMLVGAVERRLVADNESATVVAVDEAAAAFTAGQPLPASAVAASTELVVFDAVTGERVMATDGVNTFFLGSVVGLSPADALTETAPAVQVGLAPGFEPVTIDNEPVTIVNETVTPFTLVDIEFPDGASVASRRTVLDGGVFTVVGFTSLAEVRASVQALRDQLLRWLPVALLGFAAAVWFVTGRALRPVENIRREVEAISAATLDRRVASPSGNDEVARLARTMNDMLGRLDQARLRERRFIADASHELRSPLASACAQAETTQGLPDGIRADLRRLRHIVDDLVDLAKATDAPLHVVEVDLDEVVLAEIASVMTRSEPGIPHLDGRGVSAVKVLGSAPALGRLIRNLLDNALRHATSRVGVSLELRGEHAVLAVDDDGPGVPEDRRREIFERFTRLDDGRARADGGVGLGLAVVDATARRHHGSVACSSSPLGGARFEVVLPATGFSPPIPQWAEGVTSS